MYVLVIGKASVVSSAPLAVLSIVPSLILGSVVWVLKNVVFGSPMPNNDKPVRNGSNGETVSLFNKHQPDYGSRGNIQNGDEHSSTDSQS